MKTPLPASLSLAVLAALAVASGALMAQATQATQADVPAARPAPSPPSVTGSTTLTTTPEAPVTIKSHLPDSVVGEYRIDMAALDRNGDGRLSPTEAAGNATLDAEFLAVDANADGVLDGDELADWVR